MEFAHGTQLLTELKAHPCEMPARALPPGGYPYQKVIEQPVRASPDYSEA